MTNPWSAVGRDASPMTNKLVILYVGTKAPITLRRRNLKTEVSLWKRIKCFPSTLRRRNLKPKNHWPFWSCVWAWIVQSSTIHGLRKTRSAKSHDCRDTIDFEKLRFQNGFRPRENERSAFSNSSCVKGVFGKLRFRDGLVWTVGLTVEIELRLVWTLEDVTAVLRKLRALVESKPSY